MYFTCGKQQNNAFVSLFLGNTKSMRIGRVEIVKPAIRTTYTDSTSF